VALIFYDPECQFLTAAAISVLRPAPKTCYS
jgi:hypothetical protein